MANPLYPSLIPRYVDESWFASDQPVDEAAKLTELEAHEMWIPDAQYRNVDAQSHSHQQLDAIDVDDDEDEDEVNEDEVNEDDQEDDEDIDDGEDADDDYAIDET